MFTLKTVNDRRIKLWWVLRRKVGSITGECKSFRVAVKSFGI